MKKFTLTHPYMDIDTILDTITKVQSDLADLEKFVKDQYPVLVDRDTEEGELVRFSNLLGQ